MIEEIGKTIVDSELLELRESAGSGDMESLLELTRHVIDGDGTPQDLDMTEKLFATIFEIHEKDDVNPVVMIEVCKLVADFHYQCGVEGKTTRRQCRESMREIYQEYFFWVTQLPAEEWDVPEMHGIMDWLKQDFDDPLDDDED